MVLSAILGLAAKRASEDSAEQRVLRSLSPTRETWFRVLQDRGFTLANGKSRGAYPDPGGLWEDTRGNWLALTLETDSVPETFYFRSHSAEKTPTPPWQDRGKQWKALEFLVARASPVQTDATNPQKHGKKAHPAAPSDPREIRF